jgi:hypothetical protein
MVVFTEIRVSRSSYDATAAQTPRELKGGWISPVYIVSERSINPLA